MQNWPPALEGDRLIASASVAAARSLIGSVAGVSRAAAAFYDCLWLAERARQYRVAGGRWSKRLIALRDQIEQYADQGLVYVETLRADASDRAALSGIIEMLAALALFLESAGRGNSRGI